MVVSGRIDSIGRISGIVRYPVKSMAGESVPRARLTEVGLEHDRLYAFESSGAPAGMLRVTGRERRELLRYSARVQENGEVEVLTPSGQRLPVESAELLDRLQSQAKTGSVFSLMRAETPQTDVRPLSLLSVQTVDGLAEELGQRLDARRFRSNLLLDLAAGAFGERCAGGQGSVGGRNRSACGAGTGSAVPVHHVRSGRAHRRGAALWADEAARSSAPGAGRGVRVRGGAGPGGGWGRRANARLQR